MYHEKGHVVDIETLKQAFDCEMTSEIVHRAIEFSLKHGEVLQRQNIRSRKKTNDVFKRDFFELINNTAFERTLQKVRNQKDIKLVTTDK